MAISALMSWQGKPNFCWVRMLNGTRYKVRCSELTDNRQEWTKEGTVTLANTWWRNKSKEINANPLEDAFNRVTSGTLDQLEDNLVEKMHDVKKADRIFVGKVVAQKESLSAAVDVVIGETLPDDASKIEALNRMIPPVGRTVKYALDKFLELILTKTPPPKPVTYREIKQNLEKLPFIQEDVSTIGEQHVEDYAVMLRKKDLAPSRKRKLYGFLVRFIRHLYSKRLIHELPRNLESFEWDVPPQKIKTYEIEDVRQILADLPEKYRCWALLGLNCSMINSDIGNLKPGMIHGGYLTRKRVKTENASDNVPEVTYRLWPETLALLKKQRSNHPEYWFATDVGTPLYIQWVEDGEAHKKDMISTNWGRANLPIELKAFRSIGATILESHEVFGRYAVHYLANAPSTDDITRKHYAAPSQVLFDRIMDWLRLEIFPPIKKKK